MALRLCIRRYNLLTSTIRSNQRYLSSEPPPFRKQKGNGLPILLASLGFCTAAAGASFWFSDYQKQRIEEQKKEELERQKNKPNNVMSKGKPLLGGPFVLVDTDGNTVSDKDYLGKWLLIYFGFTFCPDICPEELDKITETVNLVDNLPNAPKIQPIFISVDPRRDTPELIKTYLEDFHPRFIGLTGSSAQIKRATKAYRVYYSEGPDVAGTNEYIVDHSIVTFLVDPKGQFCQHFGQRSSPEEAASKITDKFNEFYNPDG